jgi:protocatechuate 3,4-dioxygenase beta subunit
MRRFVLLPLLLSAATASAAVTGTVVADDGAPLAGARVRAFAREAFSATAARLLSSSPDAVPIAATESAADGRFSIDAKGNATIDIVVDAAGREPAAFYAADGDDAGVIPLTAAGKAHRARLLTDGKPLANALVYLGHSLLVRSDAQGVFVRTITGDPGFVIHPDYGVGLANERSGEVQVRRGAAVRGRVVARDGKTPIAGATIIAGGWPLARSGDDGAFTIAHAPARLRLVAVSGTDAGSAAVDGAKPTEIRLGTAASIGGSVTTRGSAPVAGATVTFANDGELYSAVTDAKGRYAIAALPAATYTVLVAHPAFVSARVADVHATPAATKAFTLPPRSRVRGTVLTDDNKPAAGAFVSGGMTANGINGIAMTTATGEFTVPLAVNGTLFVEASKSGYAVAISPPLTLQPGETKSGVTLTLKRGFPLQVKVVDRDRQPVANVAVDISLAGNADTSRVVSVPCSVVDRMKCRLTGADGAMEMRVVEGKYDVRVSGTDFVPKALPEQALTARSSPLVVTVERGAEVSGKVVFADGTPVADARVSPVGRVESTFAISDSNGAFTLKQLPRTPESLVATIMDESLMRSAPVKVTPPARDVTLTIPTPARIEGRVIDRTTSQPVTSFNVFAGRREMGMQARGLDVSDAGGAFVLKRVQPGSVELRVTAPGYVAGTVSDLLVEEGKALTGVEVKLDRGARVTGHVTAGGSAAAGVHVRTGMRSRRAAAFTTTDENGDYTLDGVAPGDETFDFMKEGFVTKHKSLEVVAGKDTRIDVDLDRGREIRGRVVDKSGQAVANARIAATTSAVPYAGSSTSDSDGQFTVSGLEDGRYTVSAQKNGYVSASADDVDPAAGRAVTLTMDRGGTITGRVVGLAPEELSQVRVSASGNNASASEHTDANGNFTLTGIPDGSVTLIAYRQGMPMKQSPPKVIQVANGSAPPVEIDFGAGLTIRGRVTRNAVPISGGNVNFVPRGRGGVRSPSAMISGDGSYEISGVEPGDYDIRVYASGGGNDVVPYTVVGNATFDIDLKGATARGVVLDATTSVPLPDVRIYIVPASQAGSRVWRNTTSDSDGRFVLDTLPDGTFNLRAEREHYAAALQSITVSGGGTPPIELRLARGQEAVVRLVDSDTGASLDGNVALIDSQTKKYSGSSGNGRAEDGAIHVWAAPGRYTASIHVNGYLSQNVDVTVPGAEVRVAMTRGATLVLTSRSGGKFRLLPPGMSIPAGRVTSTIGVAPGQRMPFNSLAPGVYEVDRVSDDGKTLLQKYSVVLTAGQTANLDVE